MKFRKDGYKHRVNRQLLNWLWGNSVHNKVDDECCPDFSCCKPHLKAPDEVRRIYYEAYRKDNHKVVDRLLGEFLSRLLESELPDKKVHIAGLDASREELC